MLRGEKQSQEMMPALEVASKEETFPKAHKQRLRKEVRFYICSLSDNS